MNGGRREVSILSHRPVTRSDLKLDRLFFRESVSTFLRLVVANRGFGMSTDAFLKAVKKFLNKEVSIMPFNNRSRSAPYSSHLKCFISRC